jgi:outer membrane autotransporter protein
MDAHNRLYDAVALLPDDAPRIGQALDQLSGEIHASARAGLIDDSRLLRQAMLGRLRTASAAVASAPTPALALQDDPEGRVAWAQAVGTWGNTEGDGNAAPLTRATQGVFAGADQGLGEAMRVGVATGLSRTRFDVDARSSSGHSRQAHLGVYGGGQWGPWGVRTGAGYTWQTLKLTRQLALPGLDAERLSSDYDARTAQAFAEVGYQLAAGPVWSFEPFVNAAYVDLKTDRFQEQGGAAALQGEAQRSHTTFTTLGLRSQALYVAGAAHVRARGMLGWRRASGELSPTANVAFAAGDRFEVTGLPLAQNSAVVELGLDVDFTPRSTLSLEYSGQIADRTQDHGVRLNWQLTF